MIRIQTYVLLASNKIHQTIIKLWYHAQTIIAISDWPKQCVFWCTAKNVLIIRMYNIARLYYARPIAYGAVQCDP